MPHITKVTGTNYFLDWLTTGPGLILQQANTLGTPTVWSDTTDLVSTNGFTNRYYRLRRP